MTAYSTRAEPSKRTWCGIVLTTSLAANLFLLAIILGSALQSKLPLGAKGGGLANMLAHVDESLSPRDAAAFRGVMQADSARYKDAARDLGHARRALEERIDAEDFDKAAVQRAFDDWRNRWNSFTGVFVPPLVDALSRVSPEGRRHLVEDRKGQHLGPPD